MTWVYKRTEPGLWTVGYPYGPDGEKWEPESDHGSPEEAAQRAHWLNGGEAHGCAPVPAGPEPRPGVTITRDQLETWARFPLTDEQVAAIGASIPESSIPGSLGMIAFVVRGKSADDAES